MGVQAPFSKAAIGEVLPSGAAYEAGLRSGDVVLQVDGTAIVDASQLRELIRMSGNTASMQRQKWEVLRNGLVQTMMLTPRIELDRGVSIGRVGAFIGYPPAMVRVRYGLAEGFGRAACQTWEISRLTLTMLWQILAGEASLKNISGPITIADYAGKSAALGLTQYLTFLALVSVSLGVLNLLPLPVLDGGHLMYYLWESLTGKPVSDLCKDRLLRLGLAMLLMMMSVAVFNDVSRLLG
jgi:regulator of sigma E protease